jgi:hypothetical protein
MAVKVAAVVVSIMCNAVATSCEYCDTAAVVGAVISVYLVCSTSHRNV